jgi:hypothetical protein
MKPIGETLPLRVLPAGLIVGLALLVLYLSGGGGTPAHTQELITVGYDMNTAGNTCPGDGVTDCTLGAIDACVELPSEGGVITIDVFLKDLPHLPGQPDEGGLAGFGYHIGEKLDETVGAVTAATHLDPAVNLLVQAVPRLEFHDLSDPLPGAVPSWYALVVDSKPGVEFNPPFTKGVLSRLQIDTSGRPDGIYGLTIDSLLVVDVRGDDYCDPTSPAYVGCDTLDAFDAYGLIAIGQPCPVAVGGVAQLPDVPDSSAANHIALATLAGTALVALIASAWYARERRVR